MSEQKILSTLLDLAAKWESKAKKYSDEGDQDCGTGSDVPYAVAGSLRECSDELERFVYSFSK